MKSLMVRERKASKQTNKNKLRSVLPGIGPQVQRREQGRRQKRSGGGRVWVQPGSASEALELLFQRLK